MGREIDFNVIYEYDGTLKKFSQFLTEREKKDKGKCKKGAKNKILCDLTSCPIDGAYLTLSRIGSLVILFHSPPGCSMGLWMLWGGAFSLKAVTGTKKESECITLCTNMDEEDVVYGGNNKLEKAIIDIKERFDPEHIVVLSSCCAGIIGDDVDEVINKTKDKYGLKIGWLDASGFKSSYWPNGYDLAHRYIVNNIMEPREVDPDLVNIIPYGNAAHVDELECGRLLTEMGLKVQYPLSVPHTTVNNVQKAPYAKLNVMMCITFGWQFCECMKKRFGTDYSSESQPIGTYFTKKWILSIASYFGKEKEAEKLINKEISEIKEELQDLKTRLKGKRVAISAGHDKVPSLLATCLELGLEVVYVGIFTYDDLVKEKVQEIVEMYDYDMPLSIFPQTHFEIPFVKKVKPDIFIGPPGLTPKNIQMQIPAISTHFNDFIGPYFGFKGLITFSKEIFRALNDPLPHFAPFNYLISGFDRVCDEKYFKKIMTEGI
jgi:nitrogenase molybdenum-iron protein alpha chain